MTDAMRPPRPDPTRRGAVYADAVLKKRVRPTRTELASRIRAIAETRSDVLGHGVVGSLAQTQDEENPVDCSSHPRLV